MQELFVDGVAFRDTNSYRRMLNELETQGVTGSPRLVSEVEIDAYFDRLVKLYQSIERSGYRRSASVAADGEITLRIGRNGQLIKCGQGTHRLAIALVLGLSSVPVVIDAVHPLWVLRCQEQFGGTPKDAIRSAFSQPPDAHRNIQA